ncbi:hypothetical protein RB594_000599 [Gaeumannomyces avenae]
METGSAAPRDGQGPLAQYVLSDAESRRIFEEEIVPAELGHLADHTDAEPPAGDGQDGGSPVAVLLVGQTGAGKTRTAPLLAAAMSGSSSSSGTRRPRVAHLIADTYKTYHPAYASLAAQRPTLASPATGPDARRWLAMACGLAAARGADCVVESACRHPADFQDLVRLFASSSSSSSSSQNKRYAVRVVVLAVPEALSRLGILVRFHHALPEARSGRLPLRLTPVPVHDATFAGLLDAAAWLDGDDAPADDVVVLRRGNRVAYSYSRRPCPSSSSSPAAAAAAAGESSAVGPALLRERRRPLTPEELRVAGAELDALRSLASADRPQLGTQIAEVEELLRGLESPPPPPPTTYDDGAGDHDSPFPDLQPFNPEAFVKHGRSV